MTASSLMNAPSVPDASSRSDAAMRSRILIIEDDPITRDILHGILSSRNYAVDLAEDSFSGLKRIQEDSYDLVLVDYHLPEMDGYALARLMREAIQGRERSTPLVAITADRHGLAMRRNVDQLFDGIITKPLRSDVLLERVAAILAARAESAAPTPSDDAAARAAARAIWQRLGLDAPPRIAAFPHPTLEQARSLGLCFELGDPLTADMLLLIGREARAAAEEHPLPGRAHLLPVVGLGDAMKEGCDAVFEVGDPSSWTAVATTVSRYAGRRGELSPDAAAAADMETRLLAYLHLAGRPLRLGPDPLSPAAFGMFSGAAAQTASVGLGRRGWLRAVDEIDVLHHETVFLPTETAKAHLAGRTPDRDAARARADAALAARIDAMSGRRNPADAGGGAGLRAAPPPGLETRSAGPPGDRRIQRAVLLVSPDTMSGGPVQALVARSGGTCDVVADRDAVLRTLKGRLYDLVLIDLRENGDEALGTVRRIRRMIHPSSRVPILAMTEDASPAARTHLLSQGVDRVLASPWTPADVIDTIEDAVVSTRTAPAAGKVGRRGADRQSLTDLPGSSAGSGSNPSDTDSR